HRRHHFVKCFFASVTKAVQQALVCAEGSVDTGIYFCEKDSSSHRSIFSPAVQREANEKSQTPGGRCTISGSWSHESRARGNRYTNERKSSLVRGRKPANPPLSGERQICGRRSARSVGTA